jgi:hypothetical protein
MSLRFANGNENSKECRSEWYSDRVDCQSALRLFSGEAV